MDRPLKRFGIGAKVSVLLCALVVITTGAIGVLTYKRISTSLVTRELQDLSVAAEVAGVRLAARIEAVRQDVLLLAGTPPVQGIIRARQLRAGGIDPLDGSTERLWRQRFATILATMLRAKSHYLRIRYIGVAESGREIVRVERLLGAIHTVPEAALRTEGEPPYFREARQLTPGNVYFSEVTLHREYNRVVVPYVPVLHAATPIHAETGELFGFVVLSADMRSSFEELRASVPDRRSLYVTNGQGDFLVHPHPVKTFGFALGTRYRLQDDFPQATAVFERGSPRERTFIETDAEGRRTAIGVSTVSWNPLRTERRFVLAMAASYHEVIADSIALRNQILVVGSLVLVVALALSLAFSHSLTRHLRQMTDAAEAFGERDMHVQLPVEASDEAGVLARAFDRMITQVHERTTALAAEIAERKRVEVELSESAARLRTVLYTVVDGIITIDMQGIVRAYNAAAEQLFGYTREEVIGQNVALLMPSPDREQHDDYLRRYLQTGEQRVIGSRRELVGQRKDGTTFPMELAVSEVQLEDRRLFTGIIRDITARQQAEEALRQAKEAAEAATRAKSEFLANMSHEIRTPMNGILGMTELALDTDLTAEQRDYLEMVKVSADHLLAVINDILDFSKIEAGMLDLESIDFNLRENIDDIATTLAMRAHNKGLELACHVLADVPDTVVGDPHRLWQILINLIGNAIKFTEEGEVVVRVEQTWRTADELELHFAVVDTGIGIPSDKQDALFDAFSQVDSSTTRKYGGTGLGLAISSQLVDMMGGRFWVESEVGQGSTFHFTARFGVSTVPEKPQRVARLSTLRHLPVLVVDDNATNRHILKETLTNWRMRPTVVESGNAALEALEQAQHAGTPFALVLLDVMMPEMDGFTLAEQIIQDPALASSTLMMLSSADHRGDAARCRAMGLAAYLTKPIRQSDLLSAIMAALGVASSDAAGEVPTPRTAAATHRPLCILVAEDSLVNQTLAVRLLERQGHTAVVASNGSEALAALEKQPFDVVLMDVQMPGMDGFEATEAIRVQEQATGAHIPIIAMTAHVMQGDRERCLEAGMDDYVSKPIHSEELFQTIARLVPNVTNVAPQPPAEQPIATLFDQDAALRCVDGDRELLRELVELFRQGCAQLLEAMREAVVKQDALRLRHAAHTLKGEVGNFGASEAVAAALRLEMMGRDADLTRVDEAYAALEHALDRLIPALIAFGVGEVPSEENAS